MRICGIYNTPVRLESGDKIAFDVEQGRLLIRAGDDVYVSCDKVEDIPFEGEIYVNSAGPFSKHKKDYSDLIWEDYRVCG